MADIAVDVRGLETAYRRLGVDVLVVLEPPIFRAVIDVENRLKHSPPTRPGQRYQRNIDPKSEHLEQRWNHRIIWTTNSITGEDGNNASYGPWVQSEQFQAWMHRGRWGTDMEALEAVQPNFVSDAERAVLQALEEG